MALVVWRDYHDGCRPGLDLALRRGLSRNQTRLVCVANLLFVLMGLTLMGLEVFKAIQGYNLFLMSCQLKKDQILNNFNGHHNKSFAVASTNYSFIRVFYDKRHTHIYSRKDVGG